ncbi:MAG: hypothetical protein AAB819_02635 [Patescibacteria group bacterium]
MKKIILVFLALTALGGCASAPEEWKRFSAESAKQQLRGNQMELDRTCAEQVRSEEGEAVRRAEMAGAKPSAWLFFYRQPPCVAHEAASRGGARYGIAPEVLARMPQAEMCVNANLLLRSLQAGEIRLAVGDGTVREHLNMVLKDCSAWRAERRADYATEEYFRPRWVAPYPGGGAYGYGQQPYPYYQPAGQGTCPGVFGCVGVEWVPIVPQYGIADRVYDAAQSQTPVKGNLWGSRSRK